MQNLIIFKYKFLYEIIKELEENFNFTTFEENDEKNLNKKSKEDLNSLIITNKKLDNIDNQLLINQYPVKLSYIIEKINIEFHKLHFNEKSKFEIGKYILDLNSRELILKDRILKDIPMDIIVDFVKTHGSDIRRMNNSEIKNEFEEFRSVNYDYIDENLKSHFNRFK